MSHIEPGLTIALLLATAGLIPRVRRRTGRLLTPLALAGLFLWSFSPFAVLFSWTLEGRYPFRDLPSGEADAIVILSGGAQPSMPSQPFALPAESTYRRTMYGMWLHEHWKPLPVVVSGGTLSPDSPPIAELMRDILLGGEMDEGEVWVESESHTTYENAVNAAALLRPRNISRVALVTDSVHMPRAELAFRKQGFVVVPAPCCAYSAADLNRFADYIPSSGAMEANEAALHEWGGLMWYWLRGRI